MTKRTTLKRTPVMQFIHRHYGGILSQKREDAGFDVEYVSHMTGISVEDLQDIEIGKIEPSISEFANMMDLYGFDAIFELRGEKVIFDPDFGTRIYPKELEQKLFASYDRLGRLKK